MTHGHRPISPALQIYRPQLTSVLSVTHRLTGVALGLGSVMIVVWLVAGALGPSAYDGVLDFMRSWFGLVLLAGWTFAIFFHLCNGIRHLFWDTGRGFALRTIYASGWAVVAVSMALTIACWAAAIFLAWGVE